MAPRKTTLKSLGKKGVTAKKAATVKGGSGKPKETILNGIMTRNHNLIAL